MTARIAAVALYVVVAGIFAPIAEAARCIGATPCRACTTCARCAYCKSGGTCGVCAKPKKSEAEPWTLQSQARPLTDGASRSASPTGAPQDATAAPERKPAVANSQRATVEARFVPGDAVAVHIVNEVGKAKKSVEVMAYGFSSAPIAQALKQAKERGVHVRVLLDKSNRKSTYSVSTYLANQGIPHRFDDSVAIAHNKVIIIDCATVLTGSYNFTAAAEKRNAENLVTIRNAPEVAEAYTGYFNARWKASSWAMRL